MAPEKIICVALAFIVLVLLCAQFLWTLVLTYTIDDARIKILLFGVMPVWSIPIDSITNVMMIPWHECPPFFTLQGMRTLRLGNRLVTAVVLIQRKGALNQVLLTPNDSEHFIRTLHELGCNVGG